MKMRQSLAEWEQAFVKEIIARPPPARLAAPHGRAARRSSAKSQQAPEARLGALPALLVLTLILTAVIVTVVMFRTLYLLLG